MTVSTPDTNLASRYPNAAVDCGGARIRAHCHHLATVVTIRGAIDAVNIDRITEYTRRFILANSPVVLDLSGVTSFAAVGISLLYVLDEDCGAAELEWTLIPSYAVTERLRGHGDEAMFPMARSVPHALRHFADEITTRRELLLALIRKTA